MVSAAALLHVHALLYVQVVVELVEWVDVLLLAANLGTSTRWGWLGLEGIRRPILAGNSLHREPCPTTWRKCLPSRCLCQLLYLPPLDLRLSC
eukprot:7827092-Pyramimonas_sp.AAC.1